MSFNSLPPLRALNCSDKRPSAVALDRQSSSLKLPPTQSKRKSSSFNSSLLPSSFLIPDPHSFSTGHVSRRKSSSVTRDNSKLYGSSSDSYPFNDSGTLSEEGSFLLRSVDTMRPSQLEALRRRSSSERRGSCVDFSSNPVCFTQPFKPPRRSEDILPTRFKESACIPRPMSHPSKAKTPDMLVQPPSTTTSHRSSTSSRVKQLPASSLNSRELSNPIIPPHPPLLKTQTTSLFSHFLVDKVKPQLPEDFGELTSSSARSTPPRGDSDPLSNHFESNTNGTGSFGNHQPFDTNLTAFLERREALRANSLRGAASIRSFGSVGSLSPNLDLQRRSTFRRGIAGPLAISRRQTLQDLSPEYFSSSVRLAQVPPDSLRLDGASSQEANSSSGEWEGDGQVVAGMKHQEDSQVIGSRTPSSASMTAPELPFPVHLLDVQLTSNEGIKIDRMDIGVKLIYSTTQGSDNNDAQLHEITVQDRLDHDNPSSTLFFGDHSLGFPCVIKVMQATPKVRLLKRSTQSTRDEFAILREISIHQELTKKEAGVIPLIHALSHSTSNTFMLVLPLGQPIIDTFEGLLNRGEFDHNSVEHRAFFYRMLKSLTQVHNLGLVHADLRLANILEEGLCDFGSMLQITDPSASGLGGTPVYSAPEILMLTPSAPFDVRQQDIYSLGASIFNLFTRRNIDFDSASSSSAIANNKFIFEDPRFYKQPISLSTFTFEELKLSLNNVPNLESTDLPPTMSDHPTKDELFIDLLWHMVHSDPEKRYTSKQTVEHDYFKN